MSSFTFPCVTVNDDVHIISHQCLQSHWMATEKTRSHLAASVHAFVYTLPFVLVTHSVAAFTIICGLEIRV